jgi:L-fuconolactonase
VLIDTHYHASPHWWEPVEVFLFHMDRCGISKGVLVQAIGEFDNSYLLQCRQRFPERIASVGLVNREDPATPKEMERLVREGMAGFRLSLVDGKVLAKPHTLWRQAEDLGVVVSVVGTTDQYASAAFAEVVKSFPRLKIIIEHLGVVGRLQTGGHGGDNQIPQPPYAQYRRLLELATSPNVYIKVPGFGEMMPRPRVFHGPAFDLTQVPPFIDMCVDAFGPDRMMVGTDPSSSVREGYANVWGNLQTYLTKFSRSEQDAILGGTAARLFTFGS